MPLDAAVEDLFRSLWSDGLFSASLGEPLQDTGDVLLAPEATRDHSGTRQAEVWRHAARCT